MTDHPHIAEFIELAQAVAPEVRGALHVLDDPHLPVPRATSAYTILGRCVELKAYLQSIDQWPGHHVPAIVLVEPPSDRLELLALLTHELGHCLPHRVWSDMEASERQLALQKRKILAWAAADPLRKGGEPWKNHGAPFIRRICHLWFRCLLAGVPLRLVDLHAGGSIYDLSRLDSYIERLGSELFRLKRWSFAAIEATAAPAAFAELFSDDVANWKKGKK